MNRADFSIIHSQSDGGDGNDQTETGRGTLERRYLSLAELAYPAYQALLDDSTQFVPWVEARLQEANYATTVERFLSAALGVGIGVGSILGLVCLTLAYLTLVVRGITLPLLPEVMQPWAVVGLAGVVGSSLGVAVGVASACAIPVARARERRRQIELVFPDAVSKMYTLADGGADRAGIFDDVARSEDTLGEFAVEFKRIQRQTEILGQSYSDAMDRVARTTPSPLFERFVTDMLSTLKSGGDFSTFLETAKADYDRRRKRDEESRMRLLETLGQAYINLQIFPMLLVVVLVLLAMMGSPKLTVLYVVIYSGIPVLNIIYSVALSSIKIDEPGDGYMEYDGEIPSGRSGTLSLDMGIIERFSRRFDGAVFTQIWREEARHRAQAIVRNPFQFLEHYPAYTFVLTVPVAVCTVLALGVTSVVEASRATFIARPLQQTVGWLYVPLFVTGIPYVVFFERGHAERRQITKTMAKDLRKLSNTNRSGQPLHEAMKLTAEDKDTMFAAELGRIYKKLLLGVPLGKSLVELNNKYANPRLARNISIIERAQEVSSEISTVLDTAAEAAESQRDLQQERKMRTALQVVIIELTFVVFAVIFLGMEVKLVEMVVNLIGDKPAWPNFEAVDPRTLSVLFFHGSVIQGVFSGVNAGYVQTGDVRSGLKFSLVNAALAVLLWVGADVLV